MKDGAVKFGILESLLDEDTAIELLEQLNEADKGKKAKFASELQKIEINNILKINVILTF